MRLGRLSTTALLVLAGTLVLALLAGPPARAERASLVRAVATRAAPFNRHLTRAPYLTDLVGRHVAINFATDSFKRHTHVRLGTIRHGRCRLRRSAPASHRRITVGSTHEVQWTSEITFRHRGVHCYRPVLGRHINLLRRHPSPVFRTQRRPGSRARFSFDVMGDWGSVDGSGHNPEQAALMRQIARHRARFLVTVGDNGYPSGSQLNYGDLHHHGAETSAIFGRYFWTVPGQRLPIFTAVGNHGLSESEHTDIKTWTERAAVRHSHGRYRAHTYCCVNGTSKARYASEWYAFTAGRVRFYVLQAAWGDTNTGHATPYANDYAAHWRPGAPEYKWLRRDLARHRGILKFAFFHYPIHSDQSHEKSDPYLRGRRHLEGLLGRHGVRLVFNGHAHIYQRNHRSRRGMPVTYVTGGGGETLESPSSCSRIDAYAIGWHYSSHHGSACGRARPPKSSAQVFHFLHVTVRSSKVTVRPINALGHAFDVHTYHF